MKRPQGSVGAHSAKLYGFDALVKAVDQPAAETKQRRPGVRYPGLIWADLTALQRGSTGEGELCEITGLGPIPVATARQLLGEAVFKLVITTGPSSPAPANERWSHPPTPATPTTTPDSRPMGDALPNCSRKRNGRSNVRAPRGIRTLTVRVLSPLPLPVGIPGRDDERNLA